MATNIYAKIGEMDFDGLISGTVPPVQVAARTIEKLSAAATFKRGTIMERDSSGKIHPLGTNASSNTPDCVLADDVDVGTSTDVVAAVYTGGCFNTGKTIVASGYTITEDAKDKLRMRNIVLLDEADAR